MRTEAGSPARNKLVLVFVTLILLLGLDLRIRAAMETEVISPLRADAGQYFAYAYNLRNHGAYSRDFRGLSDPNHEPVPDALRSPGYPLFLAPFMKPPVTARTVLNVLVVQALLGGLLIVAAYYATRSFLPSWAALAVALLTALSPHLVNAGVYVLTETLFSVLVGGLFAALAWLARKPDRPWLWLVAAGLIGAATLTRPTLQYFVVPLALVVGISSLIPRRRTAVIAVVLGFALVMVPWWARNQLTPGSAGDDTLKVGTLHHGMYPGFMYRDDPRSYGFPYRFDPNSKDIGSNMDAVLGEIYRRFSEQPARHLEWFLLGKPQALWSWNIVQGAGDTFVYPVSKSPYGEDPLFRLTRNAMAWLHPLVLILAVLGSVMPWLPPVARTLPPESRFLARITSLLLIYFTAVHMVGAPFPRYSVPVRPFLYAMSLFGVHQAISWLARMRTANRGSSPKRVGSHSQN